MRAIFNCCLPCIRWLRPSRTEFAGEEDESEYTPSPQDYPVFPPPPPRVILEDPGRYWDTIAARKFGAPRGYLQDSPLFALYRLYEFIVLDGVFDYRNTLEAFWRRREWPVQEIPDPGDQDAQRYAFLAACTYLVVRSFNQRVKLGLRRDNPPLITPEEADAARNVPDHLRQWEAVPDWAANAAPLADTFVLPTHDGVILDDKGDPRADPDFLAKNILLWTPHIFFT